MNIDNQLIIEISLFFWNWVMIMLILTIAWKIADKFFHFANGNKKKSEVYKKI